ncbi:MAG: hypothetical protein ABI091_28615 [Ferruginibacter sp.]
MKQFLFCIIVFIASNCNATNYYISSSGKDSNTGTSSSTPWATLSKIGSSIDIIKPGDSILFKKGDSFKGILSWNKSGTATAPIVFGSYGIGAKPIFQYPKELKIAVTERILFNMLADYIIIDGLNITDLDFPVKDKVTPANCGIAICIGSAENVISNHCIIRNCDMSNIGMGIVIYGNTNLVDSCSITDLKNLKNTEGQSGNPSSFDDDYGANGVTITGNLNVITHNYFSGNWATSYDYGFNGGAIEAFGPTSRNKIMYNTIIDCNGIIEFGSAHGGGAAYNLIAYNLMIDNGMLTWVNTDGTFAIQVSNVQYFNNTIIDVNNRFNDNGLFGFSGSPQADTVFNIKNNIFYIGSGLSILKTSSGIDKVSHQNNIYHLFNKSKTNFEINKSELVTDLPIFKNNSGKDPTKWDYTLLLNSPARRFGAETGITNDFKGTVITDIISPDAGYLESTLSNKDMSFSRKDIFKILFALIFCIPINLLFHS